MQCTNVSIILDTSASLAVRSFFFFLVVERIGVRSVVSFYIIIVCKLRKGYFNEEKKANFHFVFKWK